MLESLQESGRNSEKEKIELEVQNGTLDPESMNVIDDIITKFGQWFGKPRVEQCVDSWIKYLALKRNPNESVEDFIVKYETAEAYLKCDAVELPKLLGAIQLVIAINVSDAERWNILIIIKFDGNINGKVCFFSE